MALPKLNVPVYEAILPSTEKVIKYRPFLVKEEKLLLTALEADDSKALSSAVKQIVNNCVQGELDVDNLSTFDIEYLFLRLRAKSVGEKVTVGLRPWGCPKNEGKLCENSTSVEINLEEVKVDKSTASSSKIMLDDKIGIKMKYPDIDSVNIMGTSSDAAGMDIIRGCVDMIFTEEETYERDSFTDKELDEFIDSLNSQQFKLIKDFFDNMPVLTHTVKYKCETCGEKKETTLTGLNSFFG
ncbi:MAG TPA: baseplate protein [Verrucomicrobiota bacterium]|jgi:hypothetical protein|nr:baseplate protein [Verrucomicrobiota bacterium]